MFRRSKSEPAPEPTEIKAGGKGRPTPTRKEAEAAAKARVKTPRTRKEAVDAQRRTRAESTKTVRQAMRDGDERYYPARDKGPDRRFVRDYIDSRLLITEMSMPLLFLTIILGYSGQPALMSFGSTLMLFTLLVTSVGLVLLWFRLRRELARLFPDRTLKGLAFYAVMRAVLPRWFRSPHRQVRLGEQLDDARYRR